jgi:hypothetical protein
LTLQLLGAPVVIALGLVVYYHWHTYAGLVLLALTPVAVLFNVTQFIRVRRRFADPSARVVAHTGLVLGPLRGMAVANAERAVVWVGAAEVPVELGRFPTTYPLAVLSVDGSSLSLWIRPRLIARLFGAPRPLVVTPADVEAVFPCRMGLLRFRRAAAIGIRPQNQPPWYFVTRRERAAILSVIASAGFDVDWSERHYSYA